MKTNLSVQHIVIESLMGVEKFNIQLEITFFFWQKMTKLGQKPSILGKKYLEPRNLNERHD